MKVRANVLYQTSLFRDCVSALLRRSGAGVTVYELGDTKRANVMAAPAVVMENRGEGVDWPGLAGLLGGRDRDAVVILMNLVEDDARVISSRRMKCVDAVTLMAELESWLG